MTTPQLLNGQHTEQVQAEPFQPETPFLDTRFASETWLEQEIPSGTELEQPLGFSPETPFLTEYHGEAPINLETQALEQTLMEMFDRDFNEAVSGFAMEAAAQAEHFSSNASPAAAEQLLERMVGPAAPGHRAAPGAGGRRRHQRATGGLQRQRAPESFFEGFAPQPGAVAPEFEEFLKKVWNKVKRVARTAVSLAKKGIAAVGKLIPIGPLLKKLGRLVRPLLNRVIRFAIGRLPTSLRPAATLLGRRLGILTETRDGETERDGEASTMPEAEAIAQEFDTAVATLFFSRDESEAEAFLNEAQETVPEAETAGLAELQDGRERFVAQFSQLQTGEAAGPAVQQFIPAILPLLRVGMKIVGRQRVVKFLAGHLARLIQRYVGREAAATLSPALVDVGLRMITLETEAEAPPQVAARVVAATLEDTLRRVSQFGFEQFDNLEESLEQQTLLESVTNEAFFEAAIAHFPAQLLDARRLEERDMYFETSSQPGTWVTRPRPRYKKYTRIFEVPLTSQAAAQIRSFGESAARRLLPRARGSPPRAP